MKKLGIYIVCLFAFLLIINSCSPNVMCLSYITVVNELTYELNITFEANKYSGYDPVNIGKGETVTFELWGGNHAPSPNPNNEVEKIIFTNLDTNDVIMILDNNKIFLKTKSEKNKVFGKEIETRVYYLLKITDELLF